MPTRETTRLQRRRFLRQAGLGVVAGGGSLSRASAAEAPGEANKQDGPRRLLVTSADHPLASAIADAVADAHEVRLTASDPVATRHPFVQSALDQDSSRSLVCGIDAIIHVSEPPAATDGVDKIDYRTRGTYNLLRAAADEGIRHVLYLSSLQLLTGYDADFEVTEDWQPLPTDDVEMLSHYLGEFTCREFARQGQLGVVVLRLGTVVRADDVAGEPFQPLWVDQRDVVQAVAKALAARLSGRDALARPWSVFHIQAGSPRARFSSTRAKNAFGYAPQFP